MKDLFSVSLQEVMSPALLAVWERMSIGVAIVDADGICVFMNDIQRKVDGFSQTRVVGKHITQLYLPNGMSCVPTIECLRRGEPLLRKAYWYKTVNNSLFSSVSDFIPLFKNRVRDGVLTFTIWMDSTLLTGTGTHSAAGGAARGGQPLAGEKLRYDFASIIGQDTVLRGSIADAQEAAKSTVPVMIWGENGTGKELFAQALHAGSPRRKYPFIAVNCAKAYCSEHPGGRIRTRLKNPDSSKRQMGGRCFWMNSTPCLWGCRRNCSASCRRGACAGLAHPQRRAWTCVSSAY